MAEDGSMTDTTIFRNPRTGRTYVSSLRLPFVWVKNGIVGGRYGSADAARRAAPAGAQLFFDYSPGCGTFMGSK